MNRRTFLQTVPLAWLGRNKWIKFTKRQMITVARTLKTGWGMGHNKKAGNGGWAVGKNDNKMATGGWAIGLNPPDEK